MEISTLKYASFIPLVLSLTNLLIAYIKSKTTDNKFEFRYLSHVLYTIIAGVLLFYILKISNNASMLLTFGFMVFFVPLVEFTWLFEKKERRSFELVERQIFANTFIVGSLIFLPIVLLRIHYDNKKMIYPPETIQTFNIEEINSSLDRIQNKYTEINKAISQETSQITVTIEDILTQINEKNLELQEINSQMDRLNNQIEYYETLINLSDEEVNSVIYALSRNKYQDYIIGGVIGFFVSMIANYFSRRIQMRKEIEHDKND